MSVKLSNDTKVKEVIRKKEYGYHSAGRGLFLRISKEGTGFWVVRYMINAKRREVRIGRYPDDMMLADATIKAIQIKADIQIVNSYPVFL